MTSIETLTETTLGGLKVKPASRAVPSINLLVYGDPGVGKTVLAASSVLVEEMAPVLFIDIEGGTLSAATQGLEVDVVRVQSWSDMQSVYDALYRGEGGYRTVVLDSLTEIQKFSMYNIMRDLIKDDPDRDPDIPSMREWGKNIEQIRRLVRAFRDLQVNTIMTALANHERDTKTGLTKTKPGLSGKLSNEVAGFMDIAVYMYTKVVDGEVQRLLLTQGTDTQVAKDRTGRLPQVLEAPTMQTIYHCINNTGD